MSGVLALESAFVEAAFVIPLMIFTVWYGYYFRQRFEPLTRFIALRSLRAPAPLIHVEDSDSEINTPHSSQGVTTRTSTVDEDREKGLKFVNPSMVMP